MFTKKFNDFRRQIADIQYSNPTIAGFNLRKGGTVAGRIDECADGRVRGWIYDLDRPNDILELEVCVNGYPVEHIEANIYRPDLAKLLRDHGIHGFDVSLASLRAPSSDKRFVSVRLADAKDYEIGPFELSPLELSAQAQSTSQISSTSTMNIDRALGKSLFVIPSLNGGHLLERMLPSLRIPSDIILVLDQGSTDSTAEVCARNGVNIVQLGAQKTYTEACNIAIEIAKKRGSNFLYIANNDIVFLTDVARQLIEEMLDDPLLGIVAPSQQIIDTDGKSKLAYRVYFDLSNMSFMHDFNDPTERTQRLEADFCELTCALLRMSALDVVGPLDDDFGFYHEDADLCFRLRASGYNAAYMTHAQIAHYHSSTMSGQYAELKASYLRKNKDLFSRKFRGYGVKHADHRSTATNSWNIINRHLHRYLNSYGLLDPERPELIFSHPGVEQFDYLYTVWETTKVPAAWRTHAESYRAVFAPSLWALDILRKNDFQKTYYLPHGIETDVFQPWGPRNRFYEEKTFFWFANNQHRKGLDIILRVWTEFYKARKDARLIIAGSGFLRDAPARQWRNFLISDRPEAGIAYFEIIRPLSDMDLAMIYRSVDVCVSTSRSEGFGFTVAEAMACGTTTVFPGYSATAEFCFEGALSYSGAEVPADYSDKGFSDVGCWWEPDIDSVLERLHEAYSMSSSQRREMSRKSALHIRGRYTWRHTCMHLRNALAEIQEQKDIGYVEMSVAVSAAPQQTPVDFAKQMEMEAADRAMRGGQELFGALDGYDNEYYLETNPDIKDAGQDPLLHYLKHGWREDRQPSPHFTTRQLLASNAAARAMLLEQAGYVTERRSNKQYDVLSSARKFFDRMRPRSVDVLSRPQIEPNRSASDPNLPLFVGYVESALGIGESSRGMLAALEAGGIPFSIYPLSKHVENRYMGPFFEEKYDKSGAHYINIFELATDNLQDAMGVIGAERRTDAYNILRPYCELPRAPEKWRPLLNNISEIWAPTRFIAEAFRTIFPGPISIVPPCVDVHAKVSYDRSHFNLTEEVFYFMCSFDYYSTPARKNPLGVVAAFQEAFPPHSGVRVGLIVKSVGPTELNKRVKMKLDKLVRDDPRIVLIEGSVSRDEMLSLLGCADCYVSLHRSEGFGLGMAESLAMAKPVIGTSYSGNADFLNAETGFPVGYTLRRLRDGEYYDGDGQIWAEPDTAAAVQAMRIVAEDARAREERGQRGRELMQSFYGPKNVARVVVERLEEIRLSPKWHIDPEAR